MKPVNQIRLFGFIVAATLFGGCEKESDNTVDNTPVAARITSTIDDMATRATGTAWAAGDAIGVSGISGEVFYMNIKYVTTKGDGVFTAVNGTGEDNDIYFQDKGDATFTAYYPYTGTNGIQPGKILVDTSNQSPAEQAKYDFLFARVSGSVANPNIQFQFHHCMSRIVLNFLPGNGIVSLGDIGYYLIALSSSGTFDTGTGEAEADMGATLLYQAVPYNASGMTTTMILFPQSRSGVDISITMNGTEYKGRIDFPENPDNGNTHGLVSGYSYTYNVYVNNSTLTINPAIIDNWGDGGSENIPTIN